MSLEQGQKQILPDQYIAEISKYIDSKKNNNDLLRIEISKLLCLSGNDKIKLQNYVFPEEFVELSKICQPTFLLTDISKYDYYIQKNNDSDYLNAVNNLNKLTVTNQYYQNIQYAESIENILSHTRNLTVLKLFNTCNFDMNLLPDSITYLELNGNRLVQDLNIFPKNLKELVINCNANTRIYNLPDGLESLTLKYCSNEITTLPSSLKFLRLGDNFDEPLLNLPDNLEILDLGKMFNSELNLPNSIVKFILRSNYSYSIDFSILDNIQEITLYYDINNGNYVFNHELKKCLIS